MSYIDNFKQRALLGTENFKEKQRLELQRNFIKYLHGGATTCVTVPISGINEFPVLENLNSYLVSINDITDNDKRALDEKEILTEPNLDVDVGSYTFYDNCWWILIFKEHKTSGAYMKFIMRRCNQIVNHRLNDQIYQLPVSIENLTMYSDGMADVKYVSYADSKRQVWYGSNPVTRTMSIGTRMMLSHYSTFRITHINDFEYNGRFTGADGLIKALVLETERVKGDDIENKVAFNKVSNYEVKAESSLSLDAEISIKGNKFIYLGSKNTYRLHYPDVVWTLDNEYEYVSIINQDEEVCTLQAAALSKYVGETAMLIAKDQNGDILDMITVTIRG